MPEPVEQLRTIRNFLPRMGYEPHLLRDEYSFVDALDDTQPVRTIELAAFARDTADYRSACIGVYELREVDEPSEPWQYRALGAPILLQVTREGIDYFQIGKSLKPLHVVSIPADHLPQFLDEKRHEWAPSRVLTAKRSMPGTAAAQLDLFDVGLLPALEGVVQAKLRRLLDDIVAEIADEMGESWMQSHLALRVIFRLLAAKVLIDKGILELTSDALEMVASVNRFYGVDDTGVLTGKTSAVALTAWKRFRESLHFQNLSVDDLAYIYEHSFVTEEVRRAHAVHATPPALADSIVARLPIERIDFADRRILEPFCGHGAFLIAAMKRLVDLLPKETAPIERHEYLVHQLVGIERDGFAREVARLALSLADLPNPDGWQVLEGDVFVGKSLESELNEARVVLSNPPFERFTPDEIEALAPNELYKPAELLHRLLRQPPEMLGLVLPRSFLGTSTYRASRRRLAEVYNDVELVALPDTIFHYSDVEVVAVTAVRSPAARPLAAKGATNVVTKVVSRDQAHGFFTQANRVPELGYSLSSEEIERGKLWRDPRGATIRQVSSAISLDKVAVIHRGIEWGVSLRDPDERKRVISSEERPGYVEGLDVVQGRLEPFRVTKSVYLNLASELRRGGAHEWPWSKPKLVVNAVRVSRGPWRIVAAVDDRGLVCTQNFHGIWLREGFAEIKLEVLAAVVNSPIFNALVYLSGAGKHNDIRTIGATPVPAAARLRELSTQVTGLVRQYAQLSSIEWAGDTARGILYEIDELVLSAYALTGELEASLLDLFTGEARPVPLLFGGYRVLGGDSGAYEVPDDFDAASNGELYDLLF